MTDNPFDTFVDRTDRDHPVPTELSDGDFSKLSDGELIERTNTLSLTTAYMEVNGVRPLKNLFDILLDIAHHPYIDDVNDDDIIEWGPKEIVELKITVKQLKGLLDLIWKFGVYPCLDSCRNLQIYLWEVLQAEVHKKGHWDRGAYDTTVIEGRWMYFPKEVKE